MDDRDAILRCQDGDRAAFGVLVERYQEEAIGHALAMLRHHDDALDAAQEAFVRAFQAVKRFDAARSFYPWFYVILRNCCLKVLARRRKSPRENLGFGGILALPQDPAGGEETKLIEQALAEMSVEDRELITLKHLDGLRYEELGERLGIPAGTVMSRLYHARRRLRQKICRLASADGEGVSHD